MRKTLVVLAATAAMLALVGGSTLASGTDLTLVKKAAFE